jgi:uncharacterized protein (TIGR02996 family)
LEIGRHEKEVIVSTETGLLRALHEEPGDWTHWLVLADWLEDHGHEARAELMRLYVEMRQTPWGKIQQKKKTRLLKLLEKGARPCLPAITNSVGMTFVLIPPGRFWMGSKKSEQGRFPDENPPHEVEITRPFYLGIHQVTQAQYQKVMRDNPSSFHADGSFAESVEGLDTSRFPVEEVTWEDADTFCRHLSRRAAEKRARCEYRLPTEAEWEYACRAGVSSQPFFFRNTLRHQDANFDHEQADAETGRTCAVGSYAPNAFGLYDMHGNVWEWCNDGFDPDYYEHSPLQDPQGETESDEKVFRGGAWRSEPRICRAACRSADLYDFADDYIGLRAALTWKRELTITGPLA